MVLTEIKQYCDLDAWNNWIALCPRTPAAITHELRLIIGHLANVNMTVSPVIDSGTISVGAEYDPEIDEMGGLPITIDLIFNNTDTTITINNAAVVAGHVTNTLMHEMIHQLQYRLRDFIEPPDGVDSSSSYSEYMSRTDEIEAYAMNIADDLIRYTCKLTAIDLLRSINKAAELRDKSGCLVSPDLFAYMQLWNFNTSHPVIKRLLKKTYQYINLH